MNQCQSQPPAGMPLSLHRAVGVSMKPTLPSPTLGTFIIRFWKRKAVLKGKIHIYANTSRLSRLLNACTGEPPHPTNSVVLSRRSKTASCLADSIESTESLKVQ